MHSAGKRVQSADTSEMESLSQGPHYGNLDGCCLCKMPVPPGRAFGLILSDSHTETVFLQNVAGPMFLSQCGSYVPLEIPVARPLPTSPATCLLRARRPDGPFPEGFRMAAEAECGGVIYCLLAVSRNGQSSAACLSWMSPPPPP